MCLAVLFFSKKMMFSLCLCHNFQFYQLNFGRCDLDNLKMEPVDYYCFTCFGDALVFMKNKSAYGLVFIVFGQFKTEFFIGGQVNCSTTIQTTSSAH